MGDRATAYITERNATGAIENHLCLYWHWGGYFYRGACQNGLKCAKSRWNDISYANAQFLDQLATNYHWPSGVRANGFDDNEHQPLEICWTDGKVRLWPVRAHADMDVLGDITKADKEWTFEEFLKLKPEDL